ncbi:MAG TPA: 16S rRNA (cytosine(1402)-N(4))-methyltransferase RsmH [Atribacter sp.]|uniref:Ribosomal RNA small subunit methyltransferase H n=1 Tax=Candidatus Atribacter allofermentans TaxID=1852833 RepID=A0A1V5T1L1_9BACT|nr:16S rRNA (cytosine(1402)-N(4))-methyltransferase RsmH [Atribacter sp.]MDD3713557.1 16S rRNA (cytosine(1402)-N(4))-methyltransferase RsmH [Atribacterota bacterium]OQA60598.1 MAG: Ribosomal RNA small subunit methyltransferase H [Candidatus Atribacteria bacterium ADurb.Bin276]HQK84351.1 16S rRNA (cytosine(1402)-N(4))-methyltransferase RsmH [Atribacter sp.]
MFHYHQPVMVVEVIQYLVTDPNGVYVDATVGGGGHAKAILEKVAQQGVLVGIDRDREAIDAARQVLAVFGSRVKLVQGSFSTIAEILHQEKIETIHGVLFDLGVSSRQLDAPERGFSFSQDGPLDMRMDQSQKMDACQVVNTYSEKELADIFFYYGEERKSRKIAHSIVVARQRKPIATTGELEKIIWKCNPGRRGGIHPATRVFMALRIYINHELDELPKALESVVQFMNEGARLVVLSYHSLEDRIVKNFFRNSQQLEVINRKPMIPSRQEIQSNPRARSARMRVAQKMMREEGTPA